MSAIPDPGVGRDDDPIGSVGWAQRVRLRMQGIVNDVDTKPDALRRYVDLVKKHRAWTLMNKEDGKCFKTWEEFCEYRQPWGLGKKWEDLRPYVEAVLGKPATQLVTVSPAQSPAGVKGAGCPLPQSRKDKALRAILRAPVEVQELYREGLISQKVAAKLGPKKPSKAPSREVIVNALAEVPRERKAIDAKVREVIGMKKPTRVEQAVALVARMSTRELSNFFDQVEQYRRSL